MSETVRGRMSEYDPFALEKFIPGIGEVQVDRETNQILLANDASRVAALIDVVRLTQDPELVLWALDLATIRPHQSVENLLRTSWDGVVPSTNRQGFQPRAALEAAVSVYRNDMAWRITANPRLLAISPPIVHGLSPGAQAAVEKDPTHRRRLELHQTTPNDAFSFRMAQNAMLASLVWYAAHAPT